MGEKIEFEARVESLTMGFPEDGKYTVTVETNAPWVNTGKYRVTLESIEELLPCPFCGKRTVEVIQRMVEIIPRPQGDSHCEGHQVVCNWCCAIGPTTTQRGPAIAAWNRRA